MIEIRDDLQRTVRLRAPAERVVSLVPSITETLFALGAGNRVVGVTDYCVHPAAALRDSRRVGGTKNFRVEDILELGPDLVVANAEENRRHQIERLEEAGLTIFVTFTRTVDDCIRMISDISRLTGTAEAAPALLHPIRAARLEARARFPSPAPRVLCPIWKGPYMTINRDTFVDSMIRESGGRNIFEDHPRRYPEFTLEEAAGLRPEVILLPTEPYRFAERDGEDFLRMGEEVPAVKARRIHVVEGELLSWYGPRVARGLRRLSLLFSGERER